LKTDFYLSVAIEYMNKFIGNWRITEMEQWDQDYIDLEKPGYFRFSKDGMGEFVFGTVNGFIDCRCDNDKDAMRVEFSWDGTSEYDPVCGRGWFEMTATDQIYGKLFIHNESEQGNFMGSPKADIQVSQAVLAVIGLQEDELFFPSKRPQSGSP
jgi:hypothetical protein